MHENAISIFTNEKTRTVIITFTNTTVTANSYTVISTPKIEHAPKKNMYAILYGVNTSHFYLAYADIYGNLTVYPQDLSSVGNDQVVGQLMYMY